jgi:hypothetical protein
MDDSGDYHDVFDELLESGLALGGDANQQIFPPGGGVDLQHLRYYAERFNY